MDLCTGRVFLLVDACVLGHDSSGSLHTGGDGTNGYEKWMMQQVWRAFVQQTYLFCIFLAGTLAALSRRDVTYLCLYTTRRSNSSSFTLLRLNVVARNARERKDCGETRSQQTACGLSDTPMGLLDEIELVLAATYCLRNVTSLIRDYLWPS